MSRAVRTARGSLGATLATLLAAASHSLAGGEISALAVIVTAIIALPICVALAGRMGSVWRIGVAVGLSQFMYHWAFAGIGSTKYIAESGDGSIFASSHAAHLASIERFVPVVAEAGAADATMWVLHGVAAVLSTIIISRGERAVLALGRSIRRVFPRALVRPHISRPRAIRATSVIPTLRPQLLCLAGRPLRGPPAAA